MLSTAAENNVAITIDTSTDDIGLTTQGHVLVEAFSSTLIIDQHQQDDSSDPLWTDADC